VGQELRPNRHIQEARDCPAQHNGMKEVTLDKPLSRLKSIAVKKELRTYEQLYKYVHRYSGKTLMLAVTEHRSQLEEFFDAMEVAQEKVKLYKRPHHRVPPRLSAKN